MKYGFNFDENYAYCTMCNGRVGQRVGDQYIMSSKSEGDEEKGICHECLVKHCCETHCYGCDWYRYPNCPYIETKKIYMEE